jgi:pimeloyl-ACP methyl ester carboxylesterase
MWLYLLEGRAAFEVAELLQVWPWLGAERVRNPGPAMVIPGFAASDEDTAPLRMLMQRQGHDTYGWGQGRHLAPSGEVLESLTQRLIAIRSRTGRPVTLVGWSLGGLIARRLARSSPDVVRQVITMGTGPRFRSFDRTNLSSFADRFVPGWAKGTYTGIFDDSQRGPLPVPSTSIYTRGDGVSRWELCLEAKGPFRENIEVRGSHIGLPVNRAVILAVLDRLAQPDDRWKPFRPPALLSSWYPEPAWWTEELASRVEKSLKASRLKGWR